jgi:hypothetical protein
MFQRTFGLREVSMLSCLLDGIGVFKNRSMLGAVLLLTLASFPLFSQANLGRILGTVRDQTGAPVPGVSVSIVDVDRGLERMVTTDDAGEYVAPSLVPGNKRVRGELRGFKVVEQASIVLQVGQDLRADLVLQPGDLNEKIEVTAAPPMLDTTSATLGGTLGNSAINEVPLNGRNYQNLLTLRPGVTIYNGGGFLTQSTNGLRAHDNVYMVDGLVNNEPWTGQSIYNGAIAAGDAATFLSIDAIQEFKTEQNPRAEFGWKPGSVVNVGIKSGSNSIHGTGYAYGRDGSWDAKNFFTPSSNNPICGVNPAACNPPLELEQFGGSVGGAIQHDKLFYFMNFEEQRYSVGSPFVTSSPVACAGGSPGCGLTTPDPDTSLVDACASVPAGSRSALSLKLAGLNPNCSPSSGFPGLFPKNQGTGPLPTNYSPGLNNNNQVDSGLVKVDYHLNEKHVLTGMYFISQGDGLFNDAAGQVSPIWETNQYARSQVGSGSWTWIPNSHWVNEFHAGYSHYFQSLSSADSSVNPTSYGLNTGVTNPAYFGLPAITFTSLGAGVFQLGASWPKVVGPDGVYEFVDHVSVLKGKHAIKFGGEIMDNIHNGDITANAKGPIRFHDLPSFFEGNAQRGTILIGDAQRHLSSQGYALFLQDDWRVTPRLTINAGVRYELDTVLKEQHNLIGNFDPNAGLVQVGKQISSPFDGDHNNFAPRIGFAWDIFGNGRTVLRAGGGLMYEQLSYDMFMAVGNLLGLRSVPTGATTVVNGVAKPGSGNIQLAAITLPGGSLNWNGSSVGGATIYPLSTLSLQCGDGVGDDPGPCTSVAVAPHLRTPYVTNWTISIQRALTSDLSLEVAYVGNHGSKLVQIRNLNAPPLGSGYPAGELAYCNSNLATASSPFACDPQNDADPSLSQAARPFSANGKFPYISDIYNLSNAASSNYNGLQVVLTQRVAHGLNFTGGYTWSHALDYACDNWGCGQGLPSNSTNLHTLYGSSDWDIRHRFTFTVNYNLPGRDGLGQMLRGWSVNSIVALQTGQPWYTQDTSNDFTGTNVVSAGPTGLGERWNFYGNPSDFKSGPNAIPCASGSGPSAIPGCSAPEIPQACIAAASKLGPGALNTLNNVGCYFKGSSVLIPPALGTFGTMGRNIFRDAGSKNVDFSVNKSWRFGETFTAQFRAEFFNLFNHPKFANPEGGPNGYANNDPSAGLGMGCGCITPDTAGSNPVLGSGGPRAIQLGLKLIF